MTDILFNVSPFKIEPMGVMCLSSVLKANGHSVALTTTPNLERNIKKHQPKFVCYSIHTGQHVKVIELNNTLKEKYSFTSIFGGAHPTYFPEMAEKKGVDHIVRGDGEITLPKLISGELKYKVIMGEYVKDLDSMPHPDREIVYKEFPEQASNPIRHFMASRGCPFDCTYCFNYSYRNLYRTAKVRYRSPDNIIDEIRNVVNKYPTKFIYFLDDTFNTKKSLDLLNLYKDEIEFPFHCHIRIDILTESFIKALSDSGCRSVSFGVESGSEEIRRTVLNRNVSNKQIIKGCKKLREHGIKFRSQNMIGILGSTYEDDIETLKLNMDIKPDMAWVSIFQPYPRTVLGDQFNISPDSIPETFFEHSVLNLPYSAKLKALQRVFGYIVRNQEDYKYIEEIMNLSDEDLKHLRDYTREIADEELFGFKVK